MFAKWQDGVWEVKRNPKSLCEEPMFHTASSHHLSLTRTYTQTVVSLCGFVIHPCILVCCTGPKSLGWTSKGVDSRWWWWRTTIRFVSSRCMPCPRAVISQAIMVILCCVGSGAGAHLRVRAGQRQELQTPVEVCRGKSRFLSPAPADGRQGRPQ